LIKKGSLSTFKTGLVLLMIFIFQAMMKSLEQERDKVRDSIIRLEEERDSLRERLKVLKHNLFELSQLHRNKFLHVLLLFSCTLRSFQ
jgi:septal ring factor EnvC (AmiA/AmiB activator)